jgi:hypothetical protein
MREPYKKTRHGAWLYIFYNERGFLTTQARRQPWICPPKSLWHKQQSQPACISGGWLFCDVAKTIGGVASKAVSAWIHEWFKSGKTLETSFVTNVLCTGGRKMEQRYLTRRK